LTKRNVVRNRFKIMGPEPVISQILNVPILFDTYDENPRDHPSVYGVNMGSQGALTVLQGEDEVLRLHWAETEVETNLNNNGSDNGISQPVETPSVAFGPVEEPSNKKTDPFRQRTAGIDVSRDLTTGESVLLDQSVLNIHLNLHLSYDNQTTHVSLTTDDITGSMPDDTVPTVVGILPALDINGISIDGSPTVIPTSLSPGDTRLANMRKRYEDVPIKKIVNDTGDAGRTSKLMFQVEWGNGNTTWEKCSKLKDCAALDAYIILNPVLQCLNPDSDAPIYPV
jgi:hypothetical protein